MSMARPTAKRDAEPALDLVGYGERGAERHLDAVERPFRARQREAGEVREAEDREQRAVLVVEGAGARQQRKAFLRAAGQHHRRCRLRPASCAIARCRSAWSARVPPNAPASTSEVAPCSSAVGDGEFAVGLVLVGRERLAGHRGKLGGQRRPARNRNRRPRAPARRPASRHAACRRRRR